MSDNINSEINKLFDGKIFKDKLKKILLKGNKRNSLLDKNYLLNKIYDKILDLEEDEIDLFYENILYLFLDNLGLNNWNETSGVYNSYSDSDSDSDSDDDKIKDEELLNSIYFLTYYLLYLKYELKNVNIEDIIKNLLELMNFNIINDNKECTYKNIYEEGPDKNVFKLLDDTGILNKIFENSILQIDCFSYKNIKENHVINVIFSLIFYEYRRSTSGFDIAGKVIDNGLDKRIKETFDYLSDKYKKFLSSKGFENISFQFINESKNSSELSYKDYSDSTIVKYNYKFNIK